MAAVEPLPVLIRAKRSMLKLLTARLRRSLKHFQPLDWIRTSHLVASTFCSLQIISPIQPFAAYCPQTLHVLRVLCSNLMPSRRSTRNSNVVQLHQLAPTDRSKDASLGQPPLSAAGEAHAVDHHTPPYCHARFLRFSCVYTHLHVPVRVYSVLSSVVLTIAASVQPSLPFLVETSTLTPL